MFGESPDMQVLGKGWLIRVNIQSQIVVTAARRSFRSTNYMDGSITPRRYHRELINSLMDKVPLLVVEIAP